MIECFVCMRAVRTRPFESGNVCATGPMSQAFRGNAGSSTTTTSPNERPQEWPDHFVWLTRDLSAVTKRKTHAQTFRILNQDEYLSKRSSRKCVCTDERKQGTLPFLISGSSAGKQKGRINVGCSG